MAPAKLNKMWKKDSTLWEEYHEVADAVAQSWGNSRPMDIIYNQIVSMIPSYQGKKPSVIDFGCGKGELVKKLKERKDIGKVIGVDHVVKVGEKDMIQCNMEDLDPKLFPDKSRNFAVFSLSLSWGPDAVKQYLKQAYRILYTGGILLIVEGWEMWCKMDKNNNNGEITDKLRPIVEAAGFILMFGTTDHNLEKKEGKHDKFLKIFAVKH